MRGLFIRLVCAIALVAGVFVAGCAGGTRSEPVSISVWTYYNGEQLSAFQSLVEQFNATVGAEKGITVVGSNMGSVEDLRDAVMDSATGKVGADPIPNVFMTYADTAYAIDQMGLLVDMAPFLSKEEHDLYVTGYLEEGTLGDARSIKIFPVAKSVEVLVLSKTDFEPFAQETGASYEDLATIEGVVRTAQAYYEWTDAQTSEPNDGKAFFGRDSMANYFFIGAKQLGTTIVSVEDGKVVLDLDKNTMRKLWDNYYVPFVKGYFDAKGHYRSDDVKTGDIISLVGSSSGATYFPSQVISQDGEGQREIEMVVLPCPRFEGGQSVAVQQGAGMAVIDAGEKEVQASIEFLRWFSSPEQNIQFSVSSGYLPVMKKANTMDAVHAATSELDSRMEQILETAMAETVDNELYTPQAFENGTKLRNIFEYSLKDLAVSDAAAVQEAIDAGTPYEKALEPYLDSAHFDKWYNGLKSEAQALI